MYDKTSQKTAAGGKPGLIMLSSMAGLKLLVKTELNRGLRELEARFKALGRKIM